MKKTVLPLVVLGLASICDPENPPDLSTTANSLTSDKEPTTLALKEILQDGDEDLNFIDIGPFLKIIRASKENEDFKKMVDFYGEKKMMDKFVELSKKLSVYSAVDDENILIKKIKEIFIEFFESSVISDIDKMDIIYSIIGILIVNWSFKLVKKRKILKKIEKLMNDESIKMEELREFYCDLNNNPLSFDELLTNIINDLLKIGRVSDRKLLFELKCRFEDYFCYHDAKKKIFEILNINKFRIEDIKAYYLQKQTNNSDDVNIGKKVLKEFEKSFKELVNRVSEMLNRGETDEEIAVVIYKEYLDFFEHHKEIAKVFYKTYHRGYHSYKNWNYEIASDENGKKISVILGEFRINVRDIKFYYECVKHDDFENCYNALLKYVSGGYSYLEILKRIGQIFKPYFERNGNKEFIIIGEVDSAMKNMGVSLDDLYAYYGGMKNGKQGKYNEVDKRYFLLIRDIRGKKDFSSLDFGEMVKKIYWEFFERSEISKIDLSFLKNKE